MTNTALITGASRGLGRALARALAAEGWRLVLTARGAEDLEKTAAELGATAIPGDVADPAHRDRLAHAVQNDLDLLVNNASLLGPMPSLAEYPLDDFRRVYDVNVVAPLALIQATLPALRRRNGAIVNISSDAATGGYETWGGYGSAKAALDQISNVLAAEEPEIRVWWFDPGEMRTDMLAEAVGAEEAAQAPAPDSVVPALLRLIKDRPESGRKISSEVV